MLTPDALRALAEKIQDGVETAREKNAVNGWYNFVSLYDVDRLSKAVLEVAEEAEKLPPCTCLERQPGFSGH